MQQPSQQNYNELIVRQLDRLEERTRNIVTRSDLEALRKELVARDSLEPQLSALKNQIIRVDTDRIDDKKTLEKRMDDLETETVSRQDRLWMRLGPIVGIAAFAIALFEFLTHFKFTP